MIVEVAKGSGSERIDLDHGLNISIRISRTQSGPNAYGLIEPVISPFTYGDVIGSVAKGGSVNCEDIQFNPHGNGTHTECLGHVTKDHELLPSILTNHHFWAQVISVTPNEYHDDLVIDVDALKGIEIQPETTALVVRTMENSRKKLHEKYAGTNPTYFSPEAMAWIVENGIEHILTDLPSVDREEDGGKLLSHRVFWGIEEGKPVRPERRNCTITELIFVPDEVEDGSYFLNLMISSFESDAVPSTPILYSPLRS